MIELRVAAEQRVRARMVATGPRLFGDAVAAALRLLEQDHTKAAGNLVGSFLSQIEALVRSRHLSDADAQPLRDQATCVAAQLGS
jgi:hypothetical protein